MAGITHPEGCYCGGCVRARAEQVEASNKEISLAEIRDWVYEQPQQPLDARGGAGCPAQGGPCFCTGACRGETNEVANYPFDPLNGEQFG